MRVSSAVIKANLLVCGLLLGGIASCGRGHAIFNINSEVQPPVITDALPATFAGPALLVHGTREANSQVWVSFTGGSTALLADTGSSTTWSGTLNLAQGNNSFTLFGQIGSNKSVASAGYSITRIPVAPTVNAPTAFYVNSNPLQLNGTKEANTNISMNGSVVVPSDGLTTWVKNVTIAAGANSFTFVSANTEGYPSAAVTVAIRGSTLSAPTLTLAQNNQPLRGPTDDPNISLHIAWGLYPAGTSIYLIFDGAAPVDLLDINSQTSFDYALNLGADGNHTIEVYAQDTDDTSPSAIATVLVDTSVPAAPALTPSGALADTGNANLTLHGSTPTGSYVCVSLVSQGPCLVVSDPNSPSNPNTSLCGNAPYTCPGGAVTALVVPLQAGSNTLYVTARDEAGNISPETTTTVYRVSPPVLSGANPANGTVVTTTTLPTSVDVAPAASDASRASAAIASVHVTYGSSTQQMNFAAPLASYTFATPNFKNGTQYEVIYTATNVAGGSASLTASFIYSDGSPYWVSNDNSALDSFDPAMAQDSLGALHTVWTDNCAGSSSCSASLSTGAPTDIFYRRRDPNGTWGTIADVSLPNPTTADGVSQNAAIAVDPCNNVHVLWSENGSINGKGLTQATFGIVHRIYNAKTASWGAITRVSSIGSNADLNPTISIDSSTGVVHAAWHRLTSSTHRDVFYARYVNGAWNAEINVTGVSNPSGFSQLPSIAAAQNGNAQVVWQYCHVTNPNTFCDSSPTVPLNNDVYLQQITSASSLGFGGTYGTGSVLVTDRDKASGLDGDSTRPGIVVDSTGFAWVFWFDTSKGYTYTNNVFLKNYTGGAAQVPGYTLISTDSADASGPAESPLSVALGPVTSDGSQALGVAWGQNVGTGSSATTDIWARSGSTASGLNSVTRMVNPTPGDSSSPALVLNATSDMYVVWWDDSLFADGSQASPTPEQIYFQIALH